jgi:hypothetical protein
MHDARAGCLGNAAKSGACFARALLCIKAVTGFEI